MEFSETKALVLAMEDLDADSGNHGPLDRYLIENFLPGELRRLEAACDLLADRAIAVLPAVKQHAARQEREAW